MTSKRNAQGPGGWLTVAAMATIRWYRRIAPLRVRRSCRFDPTCSEFALQALETWGFARAVPLIVNRLVRCRPPHGGADPLPITNIERRRYVSGEAQRITGAGPTPRM